MIRNLVEIVSFSRMEFVDDTALYYRTIVEKCESVQNNYLERMGKKKKNQKDPEYGVLLSLYPFPQSLLKGNIPPLASMSAR
jgi:hypothetical protein